MLNPILKKNDKLANIFVGVVSVIVFLAVVALKNIELAVNPGFDIHIFAHFNAVINSIVSILLVVGLMAVKNRRYVLHKQIMMSAISTALLTLLKAGDHIVASNSLYGGTYNLLNVTLPRLGITTTFVDPSNPENFLNAAKESAE